MEEKNLYYYHPDHLGSSSYITDKEGQIIQHTEYIAFGETFVDEHSTSNKQPYLFNGKELDFETGLYYYGARYYDPKTSIFLNVDPLVEKTGTPYAYTYNNPIRFIDPTGMEPEDDHFSASGKFLFRDNKSTNNIIVHIGKGEYKLSQLDYSKQGTRKAVSNIIAHYASEKGMQGYVGVGTFEKGSALTNESKNIFFNVESLKGKKYDNIYNLKSSLNHEIGHVNEGDIDKYSFEQHAKIYLAEASHSDFSKTTENYKYSNAVQFAQRVLNAEENDKTYKKSFLGMINTYNKQNTGNVFIDIGTTGGLMRGAVITPFINNIEKPSKTYEDIKDARH